MEALLIQSIQKLSKIPLMKHTHANVWSQVRSEVTFWMSGYIKVTFVQLSWLMRTEVANLLKKIKTQMLI